MCTFTSKGVCRRVLLPCAVRRSAQSFEWMNLIGTVLWASWALFFFFLLCRVRAMPFAVVVHVTAVAAVYADVSPAA